MRTTRFRPLIKGIKESKDISYITVTGGDEREIVVEPDPDSLAAAGLSLDDFCQQVQNAMPCRRPGTSSGRGRRLACWASRSPVSPIKLRRLIVTTKSGKQLRVDDLARVRLWHEDRTQEVSGMNRRREPTPVVSLSIYRRLGGNTLNVAAAIDAELPRLRPLMPPNIDMHVVYNQAQFVRESVANVRDAVLIGGVGACWYCCYFLRSLRATLISAVTIPVSIAITFLFPALVPAKLEPHVAGRAGRGDRIDHRRHGRGDREHLPHLRRSPESNCTSAAGRPASWSTAFRRRTTAERRIAA